MANLRAKSSTCSCPSTCRSATYSYAFWGMVFHLDYEIPSRHLRGCKFYGIERKARQNFNAQFPMKMGWLFTRISHVCIAYTAGCSNPGFSVRYKNVVPQNPVSEECDRILWMDWRSMTRKEIIWRLKSCEHAILSMYREGKASPSDQDGQGKSHLMVLHISPKAEMV